MAGNGSALERLKAGNARYVAGDVAAMGNGLAGRREETATGQSPFAAVLGCADSRVAPEAVFDQGVGDLFVVRVAGQVADDAAIGSLEFAVDALGVELIVVLGHERCGAAGAALDLGLDGTAPGHLPAVVGPFRPALETLLAGSSEGDRAARVEELTALHVAATAKKLAAASDVVARVPVVGAIYTLGTGEVGFQSAD